MLQRFRWMFLVMFCSFFLLQSSGYAQRGRMTVEERLKSLTEQLSLKPAQADSIKLIFVAGDSARTKMFSAHQDDRSAMREAMQKLNDEQDKKIESLLTDEQKAKYQKLTEERRKRFAPRSENHESDNH